MSDKSKQSGSCLCGAIRFSIEKADPNIGACHCSICRKWGGGPLIAVDCGSEVSFEGKDNITVYNSSDWAERGFCKQCGTHLFYRLKESQQHIVPVGLLNDNNTFNFDHQIFIDEKPSYYSFANKTSDMTGAEVFAKYASPD